MNPKLRKLIGPLLAAALIVVIGFSTTYVSGANVNLLDKGVKAKADSAAFANEYFDAKIVPYILANAHDQKVLLFAVGIHLETRGFRGKPIEMQLSLQ